MKTKNLMITVAGDAGSGSSHIAELIRRGLAMQGVIVEVKGEEDGARQRPLEERLQAIKQVAATTRVCIDIIQEPKK